MTLSISQSKKVISVVSLVMISLLFLPALFALPTANAFANGQSAAVVIGQPNFTSDVKTGGTNTSANLLNDPQGIAFDSSGNLWVADSANSRVLEFKAPLSTSESASVVLGETNFSTSFSTCSGSVNINPACLNAPEGIAFDSSGNLWVSDSGDYRIVEFKSPFTNDENASLVIGQPDLVTGGSSNAPTATNLNLPSGINFDSSGNLWVADNLWNRVLEFKTPFSNGESASLVLGQDNFTSGLFPNYGGTCQRGFDCPTASSLDVPAGVTVDSSGNVWTSEFHTGRILEFKPPLTNGMSASLVLGQPGFTTYQTGGGFWCSVVTPNSFCVEPDSVAFSNSGTLWAADAGFYRVIGYNPTFATNENASIVLGRANFTDVPAANENATAKNLIDPYALAIDSSGNVWVSDSGQNRIVEYLASVTGGGGSSSSSSSTVASSSTIASSSISSVVSSATTQSGSTTPIVTSSTAQISMTSSSSAGSSSFPVTYIAIGVIVVVVIAISALFLMRRGRP